MADSGRARRLRFRTLAFSIAIGVQLPLLGALPTLGGRWAGAAGLAIAAALTAVFFGSFRTAARGDVGKARLYLGLWPFFVWWTLALLFLALAPLALVIGAVASLPLRTALAAALGAAALATAPAFAGRARVRRLEVRVPGLAPALDGYRIAQISDLHCGPFAGPRLIGRWVAAVNALGADLIAVTGDLIAGGDRYVGAVARALGDLRAPDGVFVSMGNHDYFTDGDALVGALERAGLTVLRNRGVTVNRGGDGGRAARLYVAGVDDTWTRRHDVERALAERPAGMPAVLLAHDPALYPAAAARGVELTLSGHTHGGQIAVPGAARKLNLARFISPFSAGTYGRPGATLYVNRGLGTTGPPIRLGVPREIALVTLRRAEERAEEIDVAQQEARADASGAPPPAARRAGKLAG